MRFGYFIEHAGSHIGGFVNESALPAKVSLGNGLPRYGFYISAADIELHLQRLDRIGAEHSDPIEKTDEGEHGTTIYWHDPDGNQFEFWAPDSLPRGAMVESTPERVGRISHAVFESRDLDRTEQFFLRYCGLSRLRADDIPSDTLVLPLASGGRIIYRLVNDLAGRTTGFGLNDAHTALTVRSDDFLPNYQRIWQDLPEWDFDSQANAGRPIDNPESLPARTALHVSPVGRRFKEATGRGDDFLDWDTNMFHFIGGTPIDGSMASYGYHTIEDYMDELVSMLQGAPMPR